MNNLKLERNWPQAIVACLTVMPLVAYPIFQHATQDDVTFTIDKAERVLDGRSSRYLIFTKDETFENTDSIAFFKFDSSDIYGRIDEGKTYRAKVSGARMPLFSSYRNIIEIQEKSK
ncbi:hypothetical protein C1752_03901 [Acaryochloris thomasi RCC1774]|uniref:Uncharacterized protein n=1 Tax=Acaryochloris thomasi RCC1774 TaxID=1764569 RepID=A0A2W1JQA6_9CYAN|nr:hypothetical protein [Acaryochloris thomasi]PZD72314.1 hypothetical protein C1752_03901 [Acaryochloris thomasi RCC1774]